MEDYIQHFGILGMHWGVRRTPEELGHKPDSSGGSSRHKVFTRKAGGSKVATRASRSSYKRDFREARAQGKKSATEEMTELLNNSHKMSNSDLEYAIRRIEYQQKIQQLTEKQRELNRSVFSRSAERIGNKVLDRAVDKAGDYAWEQLEKATGVALREGKDFLGKAGDDIASRYTSRKSKQAEKKIYDAVTRPTISKEKTSRGGPRWETVRNKRLDGGQPSLLDRELMSQGYEKVHNNKTGKDEYVPYDELMRLHREYVGKQKGRS